jgi:LysR family hydrogen peroxide-inducible transcriptional activator
MPYPVKPSLRQLSALLAVIDTGSFRKAGVMLDMGQPALSAQVSALEAQLGVPLLERKSTGVIPTAEGRAVAAIAREAIDAVQRIVERGRAAGPEARTGQQRYVILRMGVSASVGPYLLPYASSILRERAPGLQLVVREGTTDGLADGLREGLYDMILTQLPLRGPGLVSLAVFEEPILLMMSVDHDLASEESIRPERLKDETILTLGPGFALSRQAERLVGDTGAILSDTYEGSSMDALRMMCAVGQGIALAPMLYAMSEVRSDVRVVTRPLAGKRLSRTLALTWRKTQGTPPEAAVLASALTEAAQQARQ